MSYSLTYYSNNGKGETKGGEYTTPGYLESEIFSTDGYILYCWNTKADGTGTVYEPHQVIVDDDQGRAIGGSLYAIWRIKNQGQIRVQNGDTIVDISDICDGIYKVAGKNQPYNFITFGLIKNMFNDTSDGGYWKTRQAIDPTAQKPELIQRQTKILVNVYGIVGEWRFEKTDEDDDTLWKVTAVCRAYNMKSTTLESLLSFTITTNTDVNGDTYPSFTFHRLGDLNRAAEISAVNRYTVSVPVEYRNRLNQTISENVTVSIDTSQTPMIEKVIGTGTGVFALIAKYCGGYTGTLTSTNRIFIDDGFIYDFTNGTYNTVQSSYTQLEIEQIKARAKLPLIGTVQGRSYDAKNVELRPDEYCSTILQGLSYLSNRAVFFDEDAYFVDYQVGTGSSKSEILQYEFMDPSTYDTSEKIKVDWGGNNSVTDGYFIPEIAGLSSNADQGSQYILQSQKVISENYERTISISDSLSSISGSDIKYMYREDVDENFEFDTATRNFQTSIIALNEIVNWYKPGDAIQYNMCETKKQYTYTVESYAELLTYPAGGNDRAYTGLVLGATDFKGRVYRGNFIGGAWVWAVETDYTYENYATLERDVRYKVYSVASEIKDVQNDFLLYNTPLAAYVISYPSCMTTYIWGNPAFMDEETELSGVSAITFDSTLDNTSDSQISDNYAAKIVVGNQSLAELADDRHGFTGLILEKNWDVELYRLAGYDNGVLQAQFNTQGKITAGGGAVLLDETGMKTFDNRGSISNNWVTHIDTTGAFKTGNADGRNFGNVQLKNDGLSIFYYNGYTDAEALKFNFRDENTGAIHNTSKIYNTYTSEYTTSVFESFPNQNTKPTAILFKCNGNPSSRSEFSPVEYSPEYTAVASKGTIEVKDQAAFHYTMITSNTPDDNVEIINSFRMNNVYRPPSGASAKIQISVFGIFLSSDYDNKVIVRDANGSEITRIMPSGSMPTPTTDIDITSTGFGGVDTDAHGTYVTQGGIFAGLVITDIKIIETYATSTAIIQLDPNQPYPVYMPSNIYVGTSSENAHEFHGPVTFYDGHNILGEVHMNDEAISSLVSALCSKPDLLVQLKNTLNSL